MHGRHGVKSHIVAMIGIGGAIFVGLLLTGRSASESLYLAAVLSCPVMMIVMVVTMRGSDHQQDHHSTAGSDQDPTSTDTEPIDDSAVSRHH